MLSANNITYGYTSGTILTFPEKIRVEQGKNLLLLGASGCGKTTLLYLLSGLLKCGAGNIVFQDKPYNTLNDEETSRLRGKHFGFVFQKNHLIGHLTATQNIALAYSGAGLKPDRERISTLIEILGLRGKENQKAHALSQGEAQRVSIARALAHRPEIIFADEPTSALDDSNTERVMHLLQEQAKNTNASLIVSTHDARIKPYFQTILEIVK